MPEGLPVTFFLQSLAAQAEMSLGILPENLLLTTLPRMETMGMEEVECIPGASDRIEQSHHLDGAVIALLHEVEMFFKEVKTLLVGNTGLSGELVILSHQAGIIGREPHASR